MVSSTCGKITKSFLGESWIGLDKLHQLTSSRSYSLKIIMTDYDGKRYTALFEQFQVNSIFPLVCRIYVNYFCKRQTNGCDIFSQVGQEDGYVLTVGGFNAARSTLGDSMKFNNEMKFSTK